MQHQPPSPENTPPTTWRGWWPTSPSLTVAAWVSAQRQTCAPPSPGSGAPSPVADEEPWHHGIVYERQPEAELTVAEQLVVYTHAHTDSLEVEGLRFRGTYGPL